jgi:glutamine cyclotransferase
MKKVVALVLGLAAAFAAAAWVERSAQAGHSQDQLSRERVLDQTAIPVYNYKIIKTFPHDTSSYTEGLVMKDGRLFEGTGLHGHSTVRENDLATGKAIREISLDPLYFGEGVTILGDDLYELTYLSNTGFRYDARTFAREQTFHYPTQGWGLTTDGRRLLMSDGSSAIIFLDPQTLAVEGSIRVTDEVGPVGFLNELELANGKLYANVWQTDFIAVIDPATGKVTAWIDLEGLNPDSRRLKYPYVLNGIAYDEASGRLLVTGKCWPALYMIDLVRRPG